MAEQQVVTAAEQRVLSLSGEFALAWKRMLSLGIDLGQALAVLRNEKRGAFTQWVEENLDISLRTVQVLMQLSEHAQELAQLPSSTTIDAALKWLTDRNKQPKPIPERNGTGGGKLLRFMPPQFTTAQIVTAVLGVCFPDARTAIDVTYGSGQFWDGSAHVEVTGHDIDPQRAASGPMDFCAPFYDDLTFDVGLIDPPHLADAGSDSIMGQRFGTRNQEELVELIERGTRATWALSRLGLIVKVTDHVHGEVFQSESDIVRGALDWAVPYEQVVQTRETNLDDPKWGEQLSAYNNGSTFLIFRRGSQKHILRRAE